MTAGGTSPSSRTSGRARVFDDLVAEATVMLSAIVWHGRTVIRFSVSSWRTGDLEERDTVAAVNRAAHVNPRRTTAVGE
jgi:hypothetical protein